MNLPPLQLWIAYPDDLLNDSVATACTTILNQEEQAHWQCFKFDRHRRESLTTRALVRAALSHDRTVPPPAWRFTANQYGKPAIEPDCGLRFNASNSVGLVVCLVAESAEVGVDVEPFARAEVMLTVAAEVFSPTERAQLEVLPAEKKLDRALSLWTLKEAYIKARGLGLAIPLYQFSFLFGGDNDIRLQIDPAINDQPGHWRFFILDHAGHRIAAVVERSSTDNLQVFEARPAVASPVRLNGCAINWFPRL
jgi:4'-phosphopantetheinyl transferase